MKRIFRLSGRKGDVERDVSDEIRFHLEMRTQELIAGGMTPDEARLAAAHAFGDIDGIGERCRDVRTARGRERARHDHLHGIRQDLGFAARTLRKNPGFALSALLTLGLGIGATTAVFTVLNGVLLRPLPYPNHDRLMSVWTTAVIGGKAQNELPFSAPNFADLRERAVGRTLEEVAAFKAWSYVLGEGAEPELLPAARVTGGFFRTLGARPIAGRAIGDADARVGAPRIAVIGHDLWQRRFGGDPSIVGREITLNGERHTVVGVMPVGFQFPRGAELPSGLQFPPRTELWTPLEFSAEDLRQRGRFHLAVVGLLGRGTSIERAERELAAAMRTIGDDNGLASISMGAQVIRMQDQSTAGIRSGVLLLFGAVALVLLIACANVANLLLARTSGRQRELAIRTAIGAGRGRLIRQLITENVLLAVLGGALGIALAVWAKEWLLTFVPQTFPRLDDVAIDMTVLGGALAVAVTAGVIFGMVVAVHATRGAAAAALRSGHRTSASVGRARFRQGLVVVEVALSLVLLTGAVALARSFVRIQQVAPGFDPRGVVTALMLAPSSPSQSFAEQGPQWSAIFRAYLERVSVLPGVEAAAAVSVLPLTGAWESTSFTVEGRPAPKPGERVEAQFAVVTPDYFRAMRIPVQEGRVFAPTDRYGTPSVIIVSQRMAEANWPGESAIGKRIRIFGDTPSTVIGVVGDVRQTSLIAPVQPMFYFALDQFGYPGMAIVVRSSADPLTLVPALRRELRAVNPQLPLEEIRTLDAVVDASLAQRRFGMLLLGFFAASALALVVIGLYGVIAYGVAQRTHEIGVRAALGASRADVFRLVIGEGARVTGLGVVIGLAGALALSRVLERVLYGVSALDPATLAAVTALLAVVAMAATGIPARRAMGVEPVEALRGD
jgi:predicted permease